MGIQKGAVASRKEVPIISSPIKLSLLVSIKPIIDAMSAKMPTSFDKKVRPDDAPIKYNQCVLPLAFK
jgi:hypothetical protein